MNRDIIQLMRMNDLAYSSVPERGPAVADVEIADSFISWNSAAATTEAASATRPNEAAIPEATFDSASASEDGLSSFGVTESESISLKEAVVLSTTMGLFLVTADTTLAPKVAIFFWSLFKNLMYYWFLAVLRFLYSWISTGKSDLFFATVFKRNKFRTRKFFVFFIVIFVIYFIYIRIFHRLNNYLIKIHKNYFYYFTDRINILLELKFFIKTK